MGMFMLGFITAVGALSCAAVLVVMTVSWAYEQIAANGSFAVAVGALAGVFVFSFLSLMFFSLGRDRLLGR